MLMASLTIDDVAHVAKLAKLELTKEEIEKYKKQLSSVLEHFKELNEVETKDVNPTSQTTGLIDITREDKVDANQVLTVDEALSGTEKTKNGYFVVPAILDKEQ